MTEDAFKGENRQHPGNRLYMDRKDHNYIHCYEVNYLTDLLTAAYKVNKS
jgi:hypothetical protein